MLVIWGAKGVVDGATAVQKRSRIPMIFIGMIIVALGTSSPEFTVNVFSAIQGNVQIAIGNIVGSNIFNIAGILGLCSLWRGIKSKKSEVMGQVWLASLAIIILWLLCKDGELSRYDGFILLGCLVLYLTYIYFSARAGQKKAIAEGKPIQEEQEEEIPIFNLFWTYLFKIANSIGIKTAKKSGKEYLGVSSGIAMLLYFVFGFGLLIGGSKIMVDTAVGIARIAGLAESAIGLTIVAIGTSMPELAVSLTATIYKKRELAIGVIVGANMFNVLWALGFDTAAIRPLPFNMASMVDVYVAFGIALSLFLFMFLGERYKLERWQGAIFVVAYVLYVIYLFAVGRTA